MTASPATLQPPSAESSHSHEKAETNGRRGIEVVLTAVTLACLVLSLLGEKLGWPKSSQLALNLIAYVCGGWFGILDALPALREKRLDINFLMVVAAIGAACVDQWHEGATLLFLFSLSNTLQSYAMERSRRAISRLLKHRPTDAAVLVNGIETRVAVEALKPGDRMIVRPGEMVAADGVIRHGESDLDQASITGESVPVEKGVGDAVFAGSLNGTGSLEVEVTKPAKDSTLARIIQLVEDAQASKARTQRFLEAFENRYAMVVVGASLLAIFCPWLILKRPLGESFYRAMVLLVVASPCALVISTPASILSAIANGARRGILFKGGAHLENLAEIKAVAFDKTGTLTTGRLRVTDILSADQAPPGFDANRLLATAAALESRSEHPIARAILAAATERGVALPTMTEFRALRGQGVFARADGYLVWIGGQRLYDEHGEEMPPDVIAAKHRLESEGKTVLVLHRELRRVGNVGTHEDTGGWLGVIAVADSVRTDAADAVRRLRAAGVVHTAILTGDNRTVAGAIAKQTGVDEFHADLLPDEKVMVVRRLREKYGPVLMVGDGVNDAPALAVATVGVAMGAAGSDVALESADVVLMSDDLSRLPYAIELARQARRIVWQNIHFALGVIVLLVIATFAARLPMPIGVVGHEGSTLLVVANGLRLLAHGRDAATRSSPGKPGG